MFRRPCSPIVIDGKCERKFRQMGNRKDDTTNTIGKRYRTEPGHNGFEILYEGATHPSLLSTVKDGQKITQNVLDEHKVITTEEQFLGVISSFLCI